MFSNDALKNTLNTFKLVNSFNLDSNQVDILWASTIRADKKTICMTYAPSGFSITEPIKDNYEKTLKKLIVKMGDELKANNYEKMRISDVD